MSDSIFLLDANVLIALSTPDHTAHFQATAWFGGGRRFATCPVTQGALIRFHMRWSATPSIAGAKELLRCICELPKHEFWTDDAPYAEISERGITGHRQVTDAYLACLASRHGGMVATLDEALAAVHHAHAVLI